MTPPDLARQADHRGNAVRWRHVKTGGTYVEIARGRIESDLTQCVIYRSDHDGTVWVRPASNFDDGRFIRIEATSGAEWGGDQS